MRPSPFGILRAAPGIKMPRFGGERQEKEICL